VDNIFRYLDYPEIPSELTEVSLENLKSQKNLYPKEFYPYYAQYEIDEKLKSFLSTIFNFQFFAVYQVINYHLDIHKDRNRVECINYILKTGGENATLNFFDDDEKTVLFSEKVKPFKWHWLNVSKFHNVENFSEVRLSISITPTSGLFKHL
jgi:hypothetical protein